MSLWTTTAVARLAPMTRDMLRRSRRGLSVGLCGLSGVALTLQTGCVTSKKYKMAKANTPPAVALNLVATAPAISATIDSVIVFRGPGSWKREARWDEYVLTLKNNGVAPETLYTATLIDPENVAQVPGDDPWKLERQSRSNFARYGKMGLTVVEGAGGVVLYGVAAYGAASSAILAGGATTGAVVVLDVIPIVAIGDIATVAVMNHNNKLKVNAEFARRRMSLPITLAPGESVTKSLFFPMVPAPRALVLLHGTDEMKEELKVDLSALRNLHVQTKR